jgi:hypothetical protein
VVTDKADYSPGEKVLMKAEGFQIGSTLRFSVQDDPQQFGDDGNQDYYRSFYVADGSKKDQDGVVNGAITTSWKVPPKDAENALLHLTVEGIKAGRDKRLGTTDDVLTGEKATRSFRDQTTSINKVYLHWADGDAATGSPPEWNNNILSDVKSDYFEGEVVPHLFLYKASNNAPLKPGEAYTFVIRYNYYQANSNAGGFSELATSVDQMLFLTVALPFWIINFKMMGELLMTLAFIL